jgi:hypothetical protein
MRVHQLHPPFDHGAALRVPPPQDSKGWAVLWSWLGEEAKAVAEGGAAVQVRTPEGPVVAHCGDWIVLSHSGTFHVARTSRAHHA